MDSELVVVPFPKKVLASSSVSVLVLCIVRVGTGRLLLRSGVAADAALVALVMADMALPRSVDQTRPSYLVVWVLGHCLPLVGVV